MGAQRKTSKRKQYTAEFKHETVRLVTEGGLSMAQVARDLGLTDNLVSRWKTEAQQHGPQAFPGHGHPQDEELARLRREIEVLRQEREVLKKAISQYAAHHYQKRLLNWSIVSSMSRKGNCWDNALVESFFATLKKEEVHRERYLTCEQAKGGKSSSLLRRNGRGRKEWESDKNGVGEATAGIEVKGDWRGWRQRQPTRAG